MVRTKQTTYFAARAPAPQRGRQGSAAQRRGREHASAAQRRGRGHGSAAPRWEQDATQCERRDGASMPLDLSRISSWGQPPSEKMKNRLTKFAFMTTPQEHTYWEQIFEPIVIAAEHMVMTHEMWEVALPVSEEERSEWIPHTTDYTPPIHKINADTMQGSLCAEVGRMYTEVTEKNSRKYGQRFKTWSSVRLEWGLAASLFRTYWFLHSHLTKQQAYNCVLQIAPVRILGKKSVIKLRKEWVRAAKEDFHFGKVNNMLVVNVREVVPPVSDDGTQGDRYFVYTDEQLAQNVLGDYFVAVDAKTGRFRDMISFSRTWIKSKQASAKAKETFVQLSEIYTEAERAKMNKPVTTRKRPQAVLEAERKDAWSHQPINDESRSNWQDLEALVKLQSKIRLKLHKKFKKAPKIGNIFRPWSQLELSWDDNWSPSTTTLAKGGFVYNIPKFQNSNDEWPESELLQHLFVNAPKCFSAVIPSLESVDDSLDKGRLTKAVGECKDMLSRIKAPGERLKCKQVCLLKKLIDKAGKAKAKFCEISDLRTPTACHVCQVLVTNKSAVCHTCTRTIHVHCGYCYNDSPIDCAPCCRINKTNPPSLSSDGQVNLAGGQTWRNQQVERYVMILNFVNSMLIKTKNARTLDAVSDPDRTEELNLTAEARKVLIAVGMHDLVWMGVTNEHLFAGLRSWLPSYFRPRCVACLTIFYKISTMCEQLGLASVRVLERYSSSCGQDLLKNMMKQVKILHDGSADPIRQDDTEEAAVALTAMMKNTNNTTSD